MRPRSLTVMSARQVSTFQPKPHTALLRILDTELVTAPPLQHSFDIVHELLVDDILPNYLVYEPQMVAFGDAHVAQLKTFFELAKNYEHVIIHCSAGISRSPAVAILFARHLNRLDLECAICLANWILPNPWILSFEPEFNQHKLPTELMELRNELYRHNKKRDNKAMLNTVQQLLLPQAY